MSEVESWHRKHFGKLIGYVECPECGCFEKGFYELVRHFVNAHVGGFFNAYCPYCDTDFLDLISLADHFRKLGGKGLKSHAMMHKLAQIGGIDEC